MCGVDAIDLCLELQSQDAPDPQCFVKMLERKLCRDGPPSKGGAAQRGNRAVRDFVSSPKGGTVFSRV